MLLYLIKIAYGCNLLMDKLFIYPTVGEQYIMPLQPLFNGINLFFSCGLECPDNVKILNSLDKIGTYHSEYTTIALSSNNTHFVTITQESTINLFVYEKNEFHSLPHILINPSLECFNSIFTNLQIMFDCYKRDFNILTFQYLNKSELIEIEAFNQEMKPAKTKMLNFMSNQSYFLLYAQYYDDFQVLTLFLFDENKLKNQTTWMQEFRDFDVSQSNIYIISKQAIYQVQISQNYEFVITFTFRAYFTLELASIKVKRFFFSSSQCDFLCVISYDDLFPLQIFQAWNNSIILFSRGVNSAVNLSSKPEIQILFSEQFLVCQFNNNITINQIGIPNFGTNHDYYFVDTKKLHVLSYLVSETNYLFQFSDKIEIYSIQIPQLQIQTQKNMNKFKIHVSMTFDLNEKLSCTLEIVPQLIDKNDTNIYVTYNNSQKIFNTMQNTPFLYELTDLTGPLIKATGILENFKGGNFTDVTFQLKVDFLEDYVATNMFSLASSSTNQGNQQWYYSYIFFIGATATKIYFYICKLSLECTFLYEDLLIQFLTKIEITFRFGDTLLVGVDQGFNGILIYDVNLGSRDTVNVKSQLYNFPKYKQFLLTYDNIILLLFDKTILIYSLTQNNQFLINGQEINKLFTSNKIDFSPVNMEMNSEDLSSILYINNMNNVIALAIQNTQEIIPFFVINFDFNIYQINILNYQLVISYLCEKLVCFQVWNVQNLLNPSFSKTLPSLQMKRDWTIQSDNLFIYIQSQQSSIFVLNPQLSYHSSLYFEFQFTGNYFSSLGLGMYSIISFQNQIFSLNAILHQYLESKLFHWALFNFEINNSFQKQNFTQTQVLTIISPQTGIEFKNNITYDYNTKSSIVRINLTSNANITSNGQILRFQLTNQNSLCSVQNCVEQINKFDLPFSASSQLHMLNQTLILQDNSSFYIMYNLTEKFNYYYIEQYPQNFDQCDITAFYDQNIVTQICRITENYIQWYLTKFAYSCVSQSNCSLQNITQTKIISNFNTIQKMVSVNENNQLILATQLEFHSQLYSLTVKDNKINPINLKIQCQMGVKDFTLLKLIQIPNYYVILFVCENQLLYRLGYISDDGQFTISDQNWNYKLFEASDFIQLGQAELLNVIVLSNHYFSFLIMLTTNNAVSAILSASYSFTYEYQNFLVSDFGIYIEEIIQTIPPYGNYSLISTQVQEGFIVIVFQQELERVYAVYDWLTLKTEISAPFLMKGGINQSLPLATSMVFDIISNTEGGWIYDITNGQLFVYNVQVNAQLSCHMHGNKNIELLVLGYNSFTENILSIQLIYQPQKHWLIGLMVFVGIIFLIVSFVYYIKTKEIKDRESFYEELEL